ncbi:MAG: HDIG domain-containing protein, partial [Planctomycetota bacterium]|nr:HDIG domain-containing protein [Planctomycetota bacterium]
MKLQAAHDILDAADKGSESWPQHCRQVARVARHLASELNQSGMDIDVGLCERQGLLHDIGRSKTHGPLHGWSGFVMLRAKGYPDEARACLAHWTKGRTREELAAVPLWKPKFVDRVFDIFEAQAWDIYDSIVSVADSSVCHTTIVSVEKRHQDLLDRYGDSIWMRRAAELAHIHCEELSAILKSPVAVTLSQLYGTQP